ncbi:MAG: hypothetical protein KAT68_17605 [Bacteroidales bacterium]|nr:hypothetical protein [Bacteroidales bacterium]
MNGNLIDEWKYYILGEKWKKVLVNNPLFNQVYNICNTLEEFFPSKDFDQNNIKKENWIAYILASKNLSSLFQLNEISKLINYYKKLSDEEKNVFRLRIKKDNSINYKELRNILFEIFVNYNLGKQKLNPSCIDTYVDNKGVLKPLDSSFTFNSKKYIIECKKIYSLKYAAFWEFATRIASRFKNKSKTQTIFTDEMVSGYIGIKTDKNLKSILNQAEQDFNRLFKKYFHSLKDKNKAFIQGFAPIENDKYKICIEPDFLDKYENEYLKSLEKFDYYIKFQTRATEIIKGLVKAKVFTKITHKKVSQFVSEKVKEKIKQHISSDAHRIIFIEIENVHVFHKDGFSIPLTKENLDLNEFKKHINNDISIVFVLKTVTSLKQEYDIGFLKNSQFDPELSTKIERIIK